MTSALHSLKLLFSKNFLFTLKAYSLMLLKLDLNFYSIHLCDNMNTYLRNKYLRVQRKVSSEVSYSLGVNIWLLFLQKGRAKNAVGAAGAAHS